MITTRIKAVLFDLYGTLTYVENPVSDEEASDYLFSRGYEVSPQQFKAAWAFVAFVDYPRYGYGCWRSFLRRVLWRLKVQLDDETLNGLVKLFSRSEHKLYSDAAQAVAEIKDYGLRTAIATTIARFKFEKAIKPIEGCFDFVCTGYEAKCDKSNPKMLRKILETLNVKPEEAIVIGDDLQYDVLLPKKLGIHTILLDREKKNKGNVIPDAVAADLKEAVEIIKRYAKLTHFNQ
ncbi:MAG: HAD family hydrolase [Candidatus Bathyarchaeales archaeon]